MTTYNTGNPIGSTNPKDLYDNAENLDTALNGPALTWVDRLGNTRQSWAGATGYDFLGNYAAGITFTDFNQVVLSAGEFWRAAAGTALPYVTTGAGMDEGGAFVSVGDAVLRQDLAASTGTTLVGFQQSGAGAVVRSASDKLREFVSVKDFGAVGNTVADLLALATPAITEGTRIQTEEGFVYVVAAAGAVDHSLTTSGGVKLYQTTLSVYVDSVQGSDSNSGYLPNRPKKTIASALLTIGAVLSGWTIHLARGSRWYEQIITGDNKVSIKGYGSGKLPIIDARDIVDSANIIKTNNQVSVYQFNWMPTDNIKVAPSLWENDSRLKRVATVAACDAEAGTYFAETSYAINTPSPVYFHPTGSGNPATNGKEYKQASRYVSIQMGDFADVRDVCVGWQQADNGALVVGRHSYLEGVLAVDGTKHNIFIGSGHVKRCIAFQADRWFNVFGVTGGIPFIGYNTANSKDPLWWDECLVVMEPDASGNINGVQGSFYCHSQNQLAFGDVKMTGCESYYAAAMASIEDSVSFTVSDCFAYNVGTFFSNAIGTATNEVNVSRCEYFLDAPGGATYYGFIRPFGTSLVTWNVSDCITVLAGAASQATFSAAPFSFPEATGTETLNLTRTAIIVDADLSGRPVRFSLTAVNMVGARTLNMQSCLIDGWGYASSGKAINMAETGTLNANGNVYVERQEDVSTIPRLRFTTPQNAPGFYATATEYLSAIAGTPNDEPDSVATTQWQFAGDPVLRQYDFLAQYDRDLSTIRVYGANLISNGTFDSNIDGWVGDGTSILTWDAGRLAVARNGGTNETTAQYIVTGLDPDGVYILTADVIETNVQASIGFYTDALVRVKLQSGGVTGSKLSLIFAPTVADGIVGLGCNNNVNTTATFDNISLKRVGTLANLKNCAPNMEVKHKGKIPRIIYEEVVAKITSM